MKYPYEKLELPERARWAVAPKYDEDGAPKCTACLTCVRTCPNAILDLDVTTREDRSKHIDRFRYDIGACMMCGLCVESCPFDAILMSQDYELARYDPAELTVALLEDVEAAGPRRAVAPDAAAAATRPAAPPDERAPASAEGGGADD